MALGYAPPALRRLIGPSDHDHCRVSGEGAAVGRNRLMLADSDSAADRLRLGLVSGRVLDDRLGELLVGEDIDRALLEAGGGDLVAQRGRQTEACPARPGRPLPDIAEGEPDVAAVVGHRHVDDLPAAWNSRAWTTTATSVH
jgi:hypothetical protein